MTKATRYFAYLVLVVGVTGALILATNFAFVTAGEILAAAFVTFLLFGSISDILAEQEQARKQRESMLEELKAIRQHLCPETPAEQQEEGK